MKKTIFLNLVFTLFSGVLAQGATPFVPDEYTVALWHLDGDGVDASGNGNHLAVKTDRVSWVPGKYDQAALMGEDPWSGSCFNSDGGALTAPGSGCTYPGSGDWTVEAWVKFPSNSEGYLAVSHYSEHWAGHDPYHLGVSNGQAYFQCNPAYVSADISSYVDQWVHIAGVYRYQQDISVYINGEQVGIEPTTSVIEHLPGYDVFVGGCYCGTSTDLMVDEVRLSNIARYGEVLESPFEWTRIADLPGDQHAACAAVIDGLVYMVGGQNPSGPPNYNKMRIYDPGSNTWSDGPSMSTRRYWPGAGVIEGPNGSELYVVGGYSGYAGLSTVERYTPSLGTWETVASVTNPRGHCIMTAVVNNNLYAIGGFYNGSSYYATNEMYDRDNNVWITKTEITKDGNPLPMQAGLEAVWGDNIYIFGGTTASGALTTTLIYNTLSDTWSEGLEIPRQRYYVRAVTFGDYIYLIGGAGGSSIIDVYDPVNDSWSVIGDYPGSNTNSPTIAQSSNLVYVLDDGYNDPGSLECWVGQVGELPTHDECVNAIAVQADEPYSGSTEYATGTDTSSCAYEDTNDVWHSFVADYSYEYTISLCGSSFDTTLSVLDECGGSELACNDDTKPGVCSSTLQSQLTLPLQKGSTYFIRIAGYDGQTGNYTLTVIGPRCTEQPAMDFNNDCRVDFLDFAIFCRSWLECNLDPPELCWQ